MPTRFHVAIRHPGDARILVRANGAMPGFTMDRAPDWQVVSPVVEQVRERFGIEVVVLRAAWLGETDADGRIDRLYEATATADRLPAGCHWVWPADLGRRPTPMGRAIDAGALEPLTGDRQPWYGAAWLPEMVGWIDERLGEAGIRRHGTVRQVRSWGRSALLTLDTDRGRLWAKQVPAVFAHEVAVTGLLADVDPGIVPPLVAADVRSGRLLMEHVDGPHLDAEPEATEAWLATMARLAEIQRVLAADLGALRMAGVPSASMSDLAIRIPSLLEHAGRELDGGPGGLAAAERTALRRSASTLIAACEALEPVAAAGGPSIEHGDLSAGQVIVGPMGPVILDWSDATITHPFLAAASFLNGLTGAAVAHEPSLEDAYLQGWSRAVPDEPESKSHRRGLARELALARIVHPLHMAQLHVDRILPGLEQPWELERAVPTYLRSLVPRLATLPRILRG